MKETNPLDQSLKVLIHRAPAGFLRLAGVTVDPRYIRPDDTAINLPEYRADNVHVVEEPGKSPWALYVESHLQPNNNVPLDWCLKAAGLSKILGMPVILVVLYLEKGRYATFPSSYTVTRYGLTNEFRFPTIRLWELADLIRREIPELAPLLLMCEGEAREETLLEVREIIHHLPVPDAEKADLMAVTLMLGSRYLPREVLWAVLKEDEKMIEGVPWISDWIAEGEARGEAREARNMTLRLLQKRFGPLSPSVVAKLDGANITRCEEIAERLLDAQSLKDLGLS